MLLAKIATGVVPLNLGSSPKIGKTSVVALGEFEYIAIISSMAAFEPNIKAKKAIIPTIRFLTIFQLYLPNPFSQNVNISIAIGAINPKIEKQKAPINDTNGTMVGTAIAMKTQTNVMIVRMM